MARQGDGFRAEGNQAPSGSASDASENASVEVPEKEKDLVEEPKVVSSKVSAKQKTSKARAKKKPGVR